MRHKTTTRPNRNIRSIVALGEYLRDKKIKEISFLDVGPGMAVKYVGRLSAIRRPFELFRRIEVGMRAVLPLPIAAYESFEPLEILRILEETSEVKINFSVLDFDVTVLAVVWNQLGSRVSSMISADLSVFPNDSLAEHAGRFDVVFARTVISRIETAQGQINAAKNLVSLSKPGGILTCSCEEMLQVGCIMEQPLAPAFCIRPRPVGE
jgi:hypothetical protein